MSDDTPVDDVNPDDTGSPEDADKPDRDTPSTDTDTFDADRAKAKIAKANAEAQNLRKRLKELEPLATRAKELEDANKSETEKLNERTAAAEKTASTATNELMRLRVAMRKGLTEKQASRLVGSSEEELEADADDLLADFGSSKKPPPKVPAKPTEHLRGGGNPDEPVLETDPRKLAAAIRGDR